jgi:5-methylcytosine-specific restriction endonuclease McrBC regulatory subunit McrC
MNPIRITDNHNWTFINDCAEEVLSDDDLCVAQTDLQKIANVKISDLKIDDNPNLLVFPNDLNKYGDKISEGSIINLQGNQISTNNIMGFVGVNDTQLDIKSRFAQDGGRDYFLHYMLQKVFAINLFDIPHTSNQEQIFDFLLYLFPYYLKKALAQGLFKKYRTFEHNDANIRGVIDVSRHIRQNIPFKGTVAYNTRTHSYDNEITQLIRHTIEFIKTKPYGSSILNNDAETKRSVTEIVSATQTYKQQDRAKIIGENLRPVRHPYFAAYTDLQKICLQILRHETIKYGQEKDKVYGILFDGAWLWEEYLNVAVFETIEGVKFTHPRNKSNNVGKKMFANHHKVLCQPDFYIDGKIVLDAKYKKHDSLFCEKQREDRFQLLAYMHVFNALKSGLIVPSAKAEIIEQGEITNGGTMYLCGLNVSHQSETFIEFAEKMKEEETYIRKNVQSLYKKR